jgi:hypothetical protein
MVGENQSEALSKESIAMLRVVFLFCLLLVLAAPAQAQPNVMFRTRDGQRYLKWQKHPTTGYFFAQYQLKSNPSNTAYDITQYVIYKPAADKIWVYWYNPKTKKFWARCPTKNHPKYGKDVVRGKDIWARLPAAGDKPGTYTAAVKFSFPEAKYEQPPVPGANDRPGDKRTMPCLPPDLPPD